MKKYIQYPIEAFFVALIHYGLRFLPINTASLLMGTLLRIIGQFYSRLNKLAYKNLKLAFNEKSDLEIKNIINDMWDNLGRVVAEYSHLDTIRDNDFNKRVKITGDKVLNDLQNKPALFLLAHYSNWEIATITLFKKGINVSQIYRAANNPLVNLLVRRAQNRIKQNLIPKSNIGAKQIIKTLQNNGHIMMMSDQRMDNGISVPFFNVPAMTAPAIARLAIKYNCEIIPIQVVREKRTSNFEIRFLKPLKIPKSGSENEKVFKIMALANKTIESWIKERPDLWLWVHRRWSV